MLDKGNLLTTLDKIKHSLLRRLSFEALLKVFCLSLALFLLAMLSNIAFSSGIIIQLIFWLPFITGMIYCIFKLVILPKRHYSSGYRAISSFVEQRLPAFADRLVSAAEFAETLDEELNFSKEMAKETVQNIEKEFNKANKSKIVSYKNLNKIFLLSSLLTVILLAASIFAPIYSSSTWNAVWGKYHAGAFESGKVSFLAGDVNLTYVYPQYTGLPQMEIKNVSGDIEAYPGTRVKISVKTIKNFDTAMLVLKSDTQIELKPTGNMKFAGQLDLTIEDSYRFSFDGIKDSREHSIKLLKDRKPVVVLSYPPLELEVRETDRVKLDFIAEDDFGLSELTLVFNYQTDEGRKDQRVLIKKYNKTTKSVNSHYVFDLARYTFKPGDQVSYFLEAQDNDSIIGQKTGVSSTHILKVFSMHAHHQKLLEMEEQIWESMISLLAKYLEQEIGDKTMVDAKTVLKTLEDSVIELAENITTPLQVLIIEMGEDPLASEASQKMLENILADFMSHGENYSRIAKKFEHYILDRNDKYWGLYRLSSLRLKSISLLEKHIIDLYEMLQKQKYDALVTESQTLADMRDELRRLLEEYKQTGDEAIKKQIKQMLKEFREKLNELMRKMAEVVKDIPEDFVNMESLQVNQMNEELDSLEKLLEQGDFEAALNQLENMSQQLNDMLDKLKEGSENLGESMFSESMKKMMNFSKDLDMLLKQEKQLNQKTKTHADEFKKKLEQQAKKDFAEKLKKLAKQVKEAAKELLKIKDKDNPTIERYKEISQSRLSDLVKSLKANDIKASLEVGVNALNNLSTLLSITKGYSPRLSESEKQKNEKTTRHVNDEIGEVVAALKKMMPDPKSLMSKKQQQAMKQMSKEQQQLEQKARQLKGEMQQMSGDMPFMPGDSEGQMESAAKGMQQSGGNLQEMQPGRAEGYQQQAIHSLEQIQQGMQQAMQQMQQGMQFGGMKPGMKKQGMGREMQQEEVAIPTAEDYKAPGELRKDILDAMKQKSPESYILQTDQYYKELVK